MKKIIAILAFTALAFSFNSCSSSSDDNNPVIGGTISFKVDGVQKTFNTVFVSQNLYFEGTPDEYTELIVLTGPAIVTEQFRMTLYKNHLEDSVSAFYTVDGVTYTRIENFTMHITSNGNNEKLVGTFSGPMAEDEINPENLILITDGTFNIQY